MVLTSPSGPDWPIALRRYLVGLAVLHLFWEVIQLPLYSIWSESVGKQVFAVLHCTVGDVMIAALALLTVLAVLAPFDLHRPNSQAVWLLVLIVGLGYTVYSEWFNVSVKRSWAYGPLMPTVPLIGTGLSPLLQWIIVPAVVVRMAVARWPWERPNATLT